MRGSNAGGGDEERSGRNENMKWSREIREYKETDKKRRRDEAGEELEEATHRQAHGNKSVKNCPRVAEAEEEESRSFATQNVNTAIKWH